MLKRFFRFIRKTIVFLFVCALALNCITFIALSYRKADESYIEECSKMVRTKFKTQLTVVQTDEKAESGSMSEPPVIMDIPVGTQVKVLAIYQEGLNGNTKPYYYNIYQKRLIELPDGTRGYAELPEACLGMKIKDKTGKTHIITGIGKEKAEQGENQYFLLFDGEKQHHSFKDFTFQKEWTSHGYAYPIYTDNPGITGLSLSLGKGFYSYPFIIDIFFIPYWLRLILGISGILFFLFYIPFKYFYWLSKVSAKPLYDETLSASEARKKAQRRHSIGWWAFLILTGSIVNPFMWFVIWLVSSWKSELNGLMKIRCPRCNKMGVIITTNGYNIKLAGSSIEDFEEHKYFEHGSASADDKYREFLKNSSRQQSLSIKGRRRVYKYLESWNEDYKCPYCGYVASKAVSHTSKRDGEVIDGTVTRTVY